VPSFGVHSCERWYDDQCYSHSCTRASHAVGPGALTHAGMVAISTTRCSRPMRLAAAAGRLTSVPRTGSFESCPGQTEEGGRYSTTQPVASRYQGAGADGARDQDELNVHTSSCGSQRGPERDVPQCQVVLPTGRTVQCQSVPTYGSDERVDLLIRIARARGDLQERGQEGAYHSA
jgi:hypothetical protein